MTVRLEQRFRLDDDPTPRHRRGPDDIVRRTVRAVASRRGVLVYTSPSGATTREYYDPASDAGLPTLDGVPIVAGGHPHGGMIQPLDARVGHVRRPRVDNDLVRVELELTDVTTIALIDTRKLVEISVGYRATVEERSGVSPSGERYDAVQVHRKHDHLALLGPNEGRCGATCSVKADSFGGPPVCNCKNPNGRLDEHTRLVDEHRRDAELARYLPGGFMPKVDGRPIPSLNKPVSPELERYLPRPGDRG